VKKEIVILVGGFAGINLVRQLVNVKGSYNAGGQE